MLHYEYLPATAAAQQDLVLLHGWGSNREVWRPLLIRLRPWANITLLDVPGVAPGMRSGAVPELPDVLVQVLQCCPPRAVLVGWSLGGQLAVELAAMAPERVIAVVTLCSNPRFVAADNWPGMEVGVFAQFRARVADDPITALQRFDSLMVAGSPQARQLLRRMRELRESYGVPVLGTSHEQPSGATSSFTVEVPHGEHEPLPPTIGGSLIGLDWLAALDQRELYGTLTQPRLHLFAQEDDLVPWRVSTLVGVHSTPESPVQVAVLPHCSHLAPLDAPQALAQHIYNFLAGAGVLASAPPAMPELEKSEVAASFSRAASHYDSVARLQRDVGERLLTYLDALPGTPNTVLDLGCGTGYFRAALAERFSGMQYIGLDLAEGMVAHARDCSRGERAANLVADALPLSSGADPWQIAHASRLADADATWLVADAEALPLARESVDLVFSSLALQWCSRLEHVFAELARVLRPGGRCVFTSLGPQTLCELREAWAAVDSHQHVNSFAPLEALSVAAQRIPELKLTVQRHAFRMEYSRVRDLLDELKVLGAHNMNRRRPAGLTGRRALQTMLAAYEAQRLGNVLPATYDVIFGVLEKNERVAQRMTGVETP